MKHLDEYRDATLARELLAELHSACSTPMRVMEVCGTHTMAIFQNGLRSVLPEGIELVSGPGCPVCVTSASHIDAFLELAGRKDICLTTFGDLFRVPGSDGNSLAQAHSRGAKIEVVYSPMEALKMAAQNPAELVVFLGVGFETTTPTIAATILAAKNQGVDNFALFSTQKTMIAPMRALFSDPDLQIDGLLCPGHVSTIIGAGAWEPIASEFNLACVVGGFETADLIKSLTYLALQIGRGEHKVENTYPRAVSREANARAATMVNEIFEAADMEWRGLGVIEGSGLAIRDEYALFDAEKRLEISLVSKGEPKGCLCGEILKGKKNPMDCPLFAKRCSPGEPVGPCMVSSEGTCAAHYKYGRE